MTCRQIRIYIRPDGSTTQRWAESILGNVINPNVIRFKPSWYWFTRYKDKHSWDNVDFSDSDGTDAPDWLRPTKSEGLKPEEQETLMFLSLRFRCEIEEANRPKFESDVLHSVRANNFWASEWLDYDDAELSGHRFIGEDRSQARLQERFEITKQYMHIVSRLILHTLICEQGDASIPEFRFEMNDDSMNPTGSTFFSFHHFFCNPTDNMVPVWVGPLMIRSTFSKIDLDKPLDQVRPFGLKY